MALQQQQSTRFSGNTEKRLWNVPAVQIIDLKAAQGSAEGSSTDKFGSLSCGLGGKCYTQ
jgi:hypothetical protein